MTDERDDRLGVLCEAVESALARGEEPDPESLAREFGVAGEDAVRVVASVRAMRDAVEGGIHLHAGDLPLPALPPEYEIEAELGRGGMGVVYRARQESLGRVVAVKVVRPASLGFSEAVRRFSQEAKSLARLHHPGIVAVHDAGVAGDAVWYSMDLLPGGSLADRLRDGALRPGEAVRTISQVAAAVAHSHEHGVIHRDLKPANVLLDEEGNACVADFGLARDVALSIDPSGSSRLLGTPGYMAPEQARGDIEAIGECTDVYALGVLLYECLAGHAPFAGLSLVQTMQAVVSAEPPALRRGNRRIPAELEAIAAKAMAKRPERRYPTARAFLADLTAFAEGRPVRARRRGRLGRALRFGLRHRVALAGALVGAVVAAGLAGLVLLPRLGRSPETLASLADELLANGEASAAVTLYQEAADRYGFRGPLFGKAGRDPAADPADPVAYRIETGLADSRTQATRKLLFAGEPAAATKQLDRAEARAEAKFGEVGWPGHPAMVWARILLLSLQGEYEEADRRFTRLRTWLRDQASVREHRREGVPWEPFRYETVHLVDLVVPDLVSDRPEIRRAAGRYGLALCQPSHGGASLLESRLLPLRDRAIPALIAIVTAPAPPPGSAAWMARDLVLGFAASSLRAPLGAALATAAADRGGETRGREAAADLLIRCEDLPSVEWIRPGGADGTGIDEEAMRQQLALYHETKDLPLAKALPIEVGFAIEHPGVRTGAWLATHTGVTSPTGVAATRSEAWRTWWKENRARPPRDWLADGLGLDPADLTTDTLLSRLRNTSDRWKRYRLHLLLSLVAPAGVHRPFVRPADHDRLSRLVGLWRSALDATPDRGPWVIRVAGFRVEDAGPPVITFREVKSLPVGTPFPIDTAGSWTPDLACRLRLPGTGFPAAPLPPARDPFRSALLLDWRESGLDLMTAGGVPGVRPPGAAFTGGGHDAPAGLVLSFDSLESYSGWRGGFATNPFVLAVAESPGSDPRPWTVDDWRAKVAGNLELLRAGAEADRRKGGWNGSFGYRYQQGFYWLPRIAAKLGVPAAKDALAGLATVDTGGIPFRDDQFQIARLRAGDPAPLADPEVRARLVRNLSGEGDRWDFHQGWIGIRLLLERPEPEIRAFALDVIRKATLRPRAAARIETAIDEGRLTAPDWLARRVAGARQRAVWELVSDQIVPVGIAALAVLLVLFALPFALWPGRSPSARLPAASLLVLAGTFLLALDVYVRGRDVVPDAAGAAIALLGAGLLAPSASRRSRQFVVGGFLVALVMALPRLAGYGVAFTGFLGGLGVYVALVALPAFAISVDPGRGRESTRVYHALYSLPLGVAWIAAAIMLPTGRTLTLKAGSWLFLAFAVVCFAVLYGEVRLLVAARAAARAARAVGPRRPAG